MKEEIINELTTELETTEGDRFNPSLLESKVNSAYRDIKAAKKFPQSYDEATIEREMEKYYSNVLGLALYRYNKIGAEGQTQFSEDGVSIHYEDESVFYYGVLPCAKRGRA